MSNDKVAATFHGRVGRLDETGAPVGEQLPAEITMPTPDPEPLTNQEPPPAPPPHAHMDEH